MGAVDRLFDLYREMLLLHIGTKTNDIVFHKASEAFYEALFDAFHKSKEALQDSKQESPTNATEARSKSYKIMEEAKGIVESMVNSNKDIAVDNVLRGIVDTLGFECGTARGFCSCDKQEEPTKDEEESESPDDVSSYGIEIEVEKEPEDKEEATSDYSEEEEENNKKMW